MVNDEKESLISNSTLVKSRHHYFLEHAGLTMEEMGLIYYLTESHPHEAVDHAMAQQRFLCGRTRIIRVFMSLIEKGYMSDTKPAGGKFVKRIRKVSRCPDFRYGETYIPEKDGYRLPEDRENG